MTEKTEQQEEQNVDAQVADTDAENNATESSDNKENIETVESPESPLTPEVVEKLLALVNTNNAQAPEADVDADDNEDEEEDDVEDTTEESPALLKKIRKTNSENQKLRDRAKNAEARLLRFEVAAEAGLPLDLAARLQGETKDELLKDAETLAKIAHVSTINKQPTDSEPRSSTGAESSAESLSAIGARLFKR